MPAIRRDRIRVSKDVALPQSTLPKMKINSADRIEVLRPKTSESRPSCVEIIISNATYLRFHINTLQSG